MVERTDEVAAQQAPSGDTSGSAPDAGEGPAPARALQSLPELLRWVWRQLTSMRTALLLLFLLALAAVPGSIFPQRGTRPADVTDFLSRHPFAGPLLDRLSAFNVYASVWFAAIYLLLLISLVGCLVPRSLRHVQALRGVPPVAPRNLSRLPAHDSFVSSRSPAEIADSARQLLSRRRWRVVIRDGAVCAERGYLREVGNLTFHFALLLLLAGMAISSLFGTRGQALVIQGDTFTDTISRYSSFGAGRAASIDNLPPFSFTLTRFSATYEEQGAQRGAPRSFRADLLVRSSPERPGHPTVVEVNRPLVIGSTKVFLIGHGYAPHLTVRDGVGRVVLSSAVIFLPRNAMFLSTGVVKIPDARPSQLGFRGLLLPTAGLDPVAGPVSTFPAADSPALLLVAWKGDLGLDNGVPQSVYTLDTTRMTQVGGKGLRVGDRWALPGGLGSVTFDGVDQYATFDVAHDPGKGLVLVAALLALAGLMVSLFVRRRRLWVRASPQAGGGSLVEIAALAKAEDSGLPQAVSAVLTALHTPPPPSSKANRSEPQ